MRAIWLSKYFCQDGGLRKGKNPTKGHERALRESESQPY